MNNLKNILLALSFLMSCSLSTFAQYSPLEKERQQMEQKYNYYYYLYTNNKLYFQTIEEYGDAYSDLLKLEKYFRQQSNEYRSKAQSGNVDSQPCYKRGDEYEQMANHCNHWRITAGANWDKTHR